MVKNKEFKNCDVLINALGYLKEIDYTKVKIHEIDKALKVNFYPSFVFTQSLGPKMIKKMGQNSKSWFNWSKVRWW